MHRNFRKSNGLVDTPLDDLPLKERKSMVKEMFPSEIMEANPLFYAVMANDETEVIRLSKKKTILNKTDFLNLTPLHYAAHFGDTRLVKILLDNGADPTTGEHSMIAAVESGNRETVYEFLKRSIDVNLVSPLGETLLMIAISNDHPSLASYLIEHGAEIHRKNSEGITAFFYAIQNLHVDIVRTLLEKGVDANMPSSNGMIPLLLALHTDAYELSAKDNISDHSQDNETTRTVREQIIELLLAKGADPNVMSRYGESALTLAIEMDNDSIVTLLLRNGARSDFEEASPLKKNSLR